MTPLAVVLAGGRGTRVRHVLGELPKPLAPVAGRPFLEWVLRYLRKQGVRKAILSAGYQAGKVDAFAAEARIDGLEVACVPEAQPLGTAGGFVNALAHERTDALACNGDSLILAPLEPLALAAEKRDGALLGVEVEDASRFGTLRMRGGLLAGFDEKRAGAGVVNAGVYLIPAATLARFPHKMPLSFEYDVFPALLGAGAKLAVVPCKAPFLDIGTEDSLASAGAFIRQNMTWFE